MQSFEILKGGSQIQYGPYTTGGAINMVSTQIPRRFSGRVTASIGSFNTKPMSILVTNIKTMVTY
jgi:Fe(3+) dicitrate transport protein